MKTLEDLEAQSPAYISTSRTVSNVDTICYTLSTY